MSDIIRPGYGRGDLRAALLPALSLSSPRPPLTPALSTGGFSFHTPNTSPAESGPGVVQFGHCLNLEKQRDKILNKIDAPDVQFEVNNNDKCVNATFSPGFFAKVAKPTFYGRSKGSSFKHPATSFLITEYVPQQDAAGVDQSLMLRLAFTAQGVECSMTIHVYNTTQRLLVQGDRVMPDGNTAAVWFMKNVLADYFSSMAKSQHADISNFHDALLTLASMPSSTASRAGKGKKAAGSGSRPDCTFCSKPVNGRGKLTPCASGNCTGYMHKSCEEKHECTSACSRKRRADEVSFFNFDQDEISEAPGPLPVISVTPSPTNDSSLSSVVSVTEAASSAPPLLPITSCQVATSCTTTNNLINTRQMALPYTTSITAFATLPSITFTSAAPIFSTSAAPPLPDKSVRPKVTKPPAKRARGIATTPEEVNNEYLTRELSFAKTKITSLEASLKDRDDRIGLLKDRIASMEDPLNVSLRSQYLRPVVPPPEAQSRAVPPAQNGSFQVQGVAPLDQAPAASLITAHHAAPSQQPPPASLSNSEPLTEVMAELSLIRQQVATLQNTVSNITQPCSSNTTSPSAASLHVPSPSAASLNAPQSSRSPSGRRGSRRSSAAQVNNQRGNLPIYGAGCWVNGVPNSRDAPRRTLLGPPPPNVAPWSWLPTAAAKKSAALNPSKPSSISHSESKSNQISRSAGPLKTAPAAQLKKHLWSNKGIKLGGQAILADDQQTVRLRIANQRIAKLPSTRPPPSMPSTGPATTSAPSGPPTSSPKGAAVPNIPVQNRFDVISEEGNE